MMRQSTGGRVGVALAAWWLATMGIASAQSEDATPIPAASPVPNESPTPEESPAMTPDPEGDEPRDLGAELDALRSEVERLRESVEKDAEISDGEPRRTGLRSGDLSARAPGRLRFGGVGTAGAVLAEKEDAQFVLPRSALFLFAPIGDRVSFGGEVTLLGGGAELVDADRGMPGRSDVFLQYGAVDLVLVPDLLVLRGGLVAVPVGRTNLASDESVEDLLSRPVHALYLVPTPWSDVGGGILGGAYLGRTRVEWQGYLLSGPSAGIDTRTGFRGARQAPGTDRNADKALAGRITVSPFDALEVAISGYSGAYSPGGGQRATIGAVDLGLDAGPILLEAEAVVARTDGGTGTLGFPVPETLFGGSSRITWRFLPEVLGAVLPPALQGSSIGVSMRYSFVDTDADDPDETPGATDPGAYTRRDRLSLGLSFRPVPRCVLRAEVEYRTEAESDLVDDDRAVFSASAAF